MCVGVVSLMSDERGERERKNKKKRPPELSIPLLLVSFELVKHLLLLFCRSLNRLLGLNPFYFLLTWCALLREMRSMQGVR